MWLMRSIRPWTPSSKDFPKGVDYKIVYESSSFVRASIREVVITLIIAFILVFVVVFIFLQDWRATWFRPPRSRCPSSAPLRSCI